MALDTISTTLRHNMCLTRFKPVASNDLRTPSATLCGGIKSQSKLIRSYGEDRRPCCKSFRDSKSKMKALVREKSRQIWSALATGTKKFAEGSRTCARLSVFGRTHHMLKVGSRAWQRKLKHRESVVPRRASSSPERAADDHHTRSRKRSHKAAKLFARPDMVLAC